MDTLAQWLAAQQQQSGITQTALAARLGLTQSHVSRVLSGDIELKAALFVEMSHALGVDPADGLQAAAPGREVCP